MAAPEQETRAMLETDRRFFLESSVSAALGTAFARRAQAQDAGPAKSVDAPSVLDRTGVANYTVRELMRTDPAGTLATIATLGYRYYEVALLPSLAPALQVAGLRQVSAYVPTYLVTGNRQAWTVGGEPLLPETYTLQQAIDEAKGRGIRFLVVTYLQKAERGGLDVYRRVAAQLDKAGEACRKAGLGFAYHAHAFEYEPVEGVRPIDVLLNETSPRHLGLELDTFWASIAGQDPAAMLNAHAGRVPLVHLKDKATGTPVQYDERKVPKEAFKEIGGGAVDFAALFRAASAAGVEYFFVEQDYCVGSTPLDSLRASHDAIARLAAAGARA
jgi:sugar phosphate isomerase/epimerase